MEMPPVTRAYTTACVLTTMSVQLELLSPFQLYFNPILIWRNLQVNYLFDVSSDTYNGFSKNIYHIRILFQSFVGVQDVHNIFFSAHSGSTFFEHDIYILLLPNVHNNIHNNLHNNVHSECSQQFLILFQVWRIFTTFLFFGTFGFNFFFNMIFTYRYCRMLEENSFRGHTADFVIMFLFGSCAMVIFALFVNLLFLGKYRLHSFE